MQRPTRTLVTSTNDIRHNIATFNYEASHASDRASRIARQTTYWIYDDEAENFGPAKFVGFSGMNFRLYQLSLRKKTSGARFNGYVTRRAIERAAGTRFRPISELKARLRSWATTMFGPNVFDKVDDTKWMFLPLLPSPAYWAFVVDPKLYRIHDALREQQEEYWTVKKSNVKAGDYAALWQIRGRGTQRGVIAFAEVLSDPSIVDLPPHLHAYCIDPHLLKPARRVKIRFVKPVNLPLWLSQDQTGALKGLSVARATGGGVFKISAPQWRRLVTAAGGWPSSISETDEGILAAAQGFTADSRKRRMIEQYAVSLATTHFRSQGYTVEVKGKPYDLHCVNGQEILYVEVKGTQTHGEEILLTKNEVGFAEEHCHQMALFIVRNISIVGTDTAAHAEGGTLEIKYPWRPQRDRLIPICYSYRLDR